MDWKPGDDFTALYLLALHNRQESYALQRGYQQTTQYLMILSLIFFASEIYLLNFKSLVAVIPGTGRFSSLEGVVGITLYLLHVVLIWILGYPAQETIFRSFQARGPYLRSQLQFNLPVLFPWFLITLLSDLIGLVSSPKLRSFLNQPLGEMTYVLIFLIVLSIFFPFLIKTWWQCRPTPGWAQKRNAFSFLSGDGVSLSADLSLAGLRRQHVDRRGHGPDQAFSLSVDHPGLAGSVGPGGIKGGRGP